MQTNLAKGFGALLAIVLLAGCEDWNFEFTRPPDNQPILVTNNQPSHIADDPLEYKMQAADGRMVLWIYNPTNDPITLLGNQSSVIDPVGISHPLVSATIAPQSAVKQIFPPLRPNSDSGGPPETFSPMSPIATNDRPGFIPVSGYGNSSPSGPGSQNPALYWDWFGETDIQITLVFAQGDRTFEHHFNVRRVKE